MGFGDKECADFIVVGYQDPPFFVNDQTFPKVVFDTRLVLFVFGLCNQFQYSGSL